ncbi:hypothetical protein QYB77_003012 [Clostridium perfringens]|nr:hypothetical protein [Clostridium perfringens]ELC8460803.1 hypothetical protein [Clostridium perfringens]
MAILKPCGHVGCTKIVNEGVVYCNKHQKEYEEKQREKYKRYKRRRMHDEEQKKYQKFYTSKEWKRIREMSIMDTLAIDVIDYYKLNKITQGEIVHHIVEVSEDYNKRLNKENLIYLTARNHKIVHNEYNNGNKARMQELLFDLKARFMDEFRLGGGV